MDAKKYKFKIITTNLALDLESQASSPMTARCASYVPIPGQTWRILEPPGGHSDVGGKVGPTDGERKSLEGKTTIGRKNERRDGRTDVR